MPKGRIFTWVTIMLFDTNKTTKENLLITTLSINAHSRLRANIIPRNSYTLYVVDQPYKYNTKIVNKKGVIDLGKGLYGVFNIYQSKVNNELFMKQLTVLKESQLKVSKNLHFGSYYKESFNINIKKVSYSEKFFDNNYYDFLNEYNYTTLIQNVKNITLQEFNKLKSEGYKVINGGRNSEKKYVVSDRFRFIANI